MEAGGRSFLLPIPVVPQRNRGVALCISVLAWGQVPAWWKGCPLPKVGFGDR